MSPPPFPFCGPHPKHNTWEAQVPDPSVSQHTPTIKMCVCVCLLMLQYPKGREDDFNWVTQITSYPKSLVHEYCTHTHTHTRLHTLSLMHVSECVLIMAISIFMIIASLLLFAHSINLHLLPAD